jgi:hypothetical protein
VILTKTVQYEVLLIADDEFQAKARATCGPFEKIIDKEGVYSVKATDQSMTNFNVQITELDVKRFNSKIYSPSEICQVCGEPFWTRDGCEVCT